MRRAARTRGVTLQEALISAVILSGIALTILATTVPASDVSSESALAMDMDGEAERLLGQLRRELRQSGFQPDGTARVRVPAPDQLELYLRVAPEGDPAPWRPAGALWASPIRYRLVSGSVMRSEGANDVRVVSNVSDLRFTLPANGNTLLISVTFTRRGTHAERGGAPAPVVRTYGDQVEMLNRAQ